MLSQALGSSYSSDRVLVICELIEKHPFGLVEAEGLENPVAWVELDIPWPLR